MKIVEVIKKFPKLAGTLIGITGLGTGAVIDKPISDVLLSTLDKRYALVDHIHSGNELVDVTSYDKAINDVVAKIEERTIYTCGVKKQ